MITYLKQPWLLYLHRSNLPKGTQVKKNYRVIIVDLKISIEAGRYTTDLYDKRETFKC